MNIKYLVSYSGLIPFFYLILDGYFFEILDINFIINISIMMACIIFTFIGAYNWNFNQNNPLLEFYGFLPSLISMIVLLLNLLDFEKSMLMYTLIIAFIIQVVIDLYITFIDLFPIKYFIKLRIPITISLCISLFLLSNLIDLHI